MAAKRVRWDEMRTVAEELAAERLEALSELREEASRMADGDMSAEEMRARASEIAGRADEKLAELRTSLGAMREQAADTLADAPEAIGQSLSDAASDQTRSARIRIRRAARRHDTAMRQRMEGAPDTPVRIVENYPWAAFDFALAFALAVGFFLGALAARAALRR